MHYMENYKAWLDDPYFDEATKAELRAIAGNEKEIEERFYKSLEFGTGGLRGIIGAGTNRMNIYTVRKATQGLANYILKQGGDVKKMGVCIAFDSRRFSPVFASEAALVLNGNGIKTYVFDELRPTPELSFAVRELGCIAGIVITASHNPPEYNGYKAYWSDGGQIPYPRDEEIIDEVNLVEKFSQIKSADLDEAKKAGLYNIVGADIDAAFDKQVLAQNLNRDAIAQVKDDFKIVYTPLHGTGNKPVRRILAALGFKNVYVVPEQEKPDSEFSTVSYPNPEDPKAFTLALKLADEVGADIVIGTDPDADRIGAVVKDANGDYVILTGNMTGALLADYVLSQRRQSGAMPQNPVIISTIVSTNMTAVIAKAYDAELINVLTGFKYIGEKIKEFEQAGDKQFLFGFEESYGCLCGTYARDKDAVGATALLCEMAAYYKCQGMTVYDALQALYKKYGYFKESVQSITLKGIEGIENIKKIMANLRHNPPKTVGALNVLSAADYKTGIVKNAVGEENPTGLPVSDVLYYTLDGGHWFCIRPSGTEPKIKIYFGVTADSHAAADKLLATVTADAMAIVNQANV